MIVGEIKKIVKRTSFKIVVIILFLDVIIDFLLTCKSYYGSELTWVRSAHLCTILNNDVSNFTAMMFSTLLSIVACMIASDIYYEEEDMGLTNMIYTRRKKGEDIKGKLIAISLTVFMVVFLALMLNYVLACITFPKQGNYCENATYLTLSDWETNRIFAYLRMYHPYLNLFVFVLIRCLAATAFAVLSFAFSLCYKKNRYVVLLFSMIYYVVYSNIIAVIPLKVVHGSVLGVNGYGSPWMIMFFFVVTYGISACMIWRGVRKENY